MRKETHKAALKIGSHTHTHTHTLSHSNCHIGVHFNGSNQQRKASLGCPRKRMGRGVLYQIFAQNHQVPNFEDMLGQIESLSWGATDLVMSRPLLAARCTR